MTDIEAMSEAELVALRERAEKFQQRLIDCAEHCRITGESTDEIGFREEANVIRDLLAAVSTARVPDEVRRLAEQVIYDFDKATEICKAQGQRSPLINREVKLARALLGKGGE